MIIPRDRKAQPILDTPDPRKSDILRLMKSVEPNALAESYAIDYRTGEYTRGWHPDAYKIGELVWNGEDILNYERNDMELSQEFRTMALEIIDREVESTSQTLTTFSL